MTDPFRIHKEPIGNLSETNKEHIRNPKGIHMAARGNPWGIHWEAIANPLGNHRGPLEGPSESNKESMRIPKRIHWESVTNCTESLRNLNVIYKENKKNTLGMHREFQKRPSRMVSIGEGSLRKHWESIKIKDRNIILGESFGNPLGNHD